MEWRMYSSNNVTKIVIVAAMIGGAVYAVVKYNESKEREVTTIVESIREIAAIINETGGQDPERIASAVAKLENSSLANIEVAIMDVKDGPAEFIAVELILRRIFEMKGTAVLNSGIERDRYKAKSYPWTIEGEDAVLAPFEVMSDPPQKIKFVYETYSSQGDVRRPWR